MFQIICDHALAHDWGIEMKFRLQQNLLKAAGASPLMIVLMVNNLSSFSSWKSPSEMHFCFCVECVKVRLLQESVASSASKSSIRRFVITEKAPTRAFSWLKVAATAFTFKTLLRHYANVKLGPRHNYFKGRAAIRHYANQTPRPLWPLRRGPNFTLRDSGVNTHLA